MLTPPGVLQDARQQEPVEVAVRLGVEVADVGAQPQADEELLDPRLLARRGCGGRGRPSEGLREEGGQEDVAAGPQQGLLEDALQFTDVARPRVGAQPLERLRGGLAHVAPQFATETAQKVPDRAAAGHRPAPAMGASGW